MSLCYCLFRYIDDEITASLKYALLSSVLNYNNHLNKSRHGWWPNLCKNWYRAEKAPIVKYWIHFYTPASMKLIGGGVYWFHLIRRSVRPSIRPIDFGQPLNYFPCHQRTMAVNFPALVRQCIFPSMPDIVVCSEIKTRYEYLTYGCSEEIHLKTKFMIAFGFCHPRVVTWLFSIDKIVFVFITQVFFNMTN